MTTKTSEIGRALVRRLSVIGEVSDDDETALLALEGNIRGIPRNKDILKVGQRASCTVVVLEGLLAHYSTGPQGQFRIQAVHLPDDAPSLETLHIQHVDANLCALTDSVIGLIPHENLHALMARRPNVLHLVWRETLIQAATARKWVERNGAMPARSAMAHAFCELWTRSEASGRTHGQSAAIPLTQEMLADMLGITSVHVSRMLREFRDEGLADFANGELKIMRPGALADVAGFDPRYLHHRADQAERIRASA